MIPTLCSIRVKFNKKMFLGVAAPAVNRKLAKDIKDWDRPYFAIIARLHQGWDITVLCPDGNVPVMWWEVSYAGEEEKFDLYAWCVKQRLDMKLGKAKREAVETIHKVESYERQNNCHAVVD